MLCRVMAPSGRGKVFGCGRFCGGSAGSCDAEVTLLAPLVPPLGAVCALFCAIEEVAPKTLSPPMIVTSKNILLPKISNRAIVFTFFPRFLFFRRGILSRHPRAHPTISDSPLFVGDVAALRTRC